MGLSWQQGPLGQDPIGKFLVAGEEVRELRYAEPLRRLMSAELGGEKIVSSEGATLLFEPNRYPVAYFPIGDVAEGVLEATDRVTDHPGLGPTRWFAVHGGAETRQRAAWQYIDLPPYAAMLEGKVAFAWSAMDAYYEEADRIIGHAADPYHRIDVRRSTRRVVVESGGARVADTSAALVLYESGFAPRWYLPEADVEMEALASVDRQSFCPYKGVCSYYDVGGQKLAAWSYREPIPDMPRIRGMISFEPQLVSVTIDGDALLPQPGQGVISHGIDRNLTIDEAGGLEL
jgi:uncharacterized protein (DUF427 family)